MVLVKRVKELVAAKGFEQALCNCYPPAITKFVLLTQFLGQVSSMDKQLIDLLFLHLVAIDLCLLSTRKSGARGKRSERRRPRHIRGLLLFMAAAIGAPLGSILEH